MEERIMNGTKPDNNELIEKLDSLLDYLIDLRAVVAPDSPPLSLGERSKSVQTFPGIDFNDQTHLAYLYCCHYEGIRIRTVYELLAMFREELGLPKSYSETELLRKNLAYMVKTKGLPTPYMRKKRRTMAKGA